MSEIIEKLKELRQEFQLTANEISIGCRSRERTVWRWIHGGNNPSPQAVIEIEKFIKQTRAKFEKEEEEKLGRYEGLILNEIYNDEHGFFHANPKPGETYSEGTYPVGIARKDASLRMLSRACEIRLTDPIVLKVLDNLTEQGRIKIISVFVPIRKNFEHLTFKVEIGEAKREIPAQDQTFKLTRSYKDKPLTKKEIKVSPGIMNPRKQVESMYKRHEDSLRLRYGASGIEAEIREHKERVEDEAMARISQLEASESLAKINGKGAKKMEGDQIPVSEFTEVKTFKKVREFYEEAVENNTDRPAIVYDCNGKKVEIPPHEKRIVLKARMLEPMPVSKEIKIKK